MVIQLLIAVMEMKQCRRASQILLESRFQPVETWKAILLMRVTRQIWDPLLTYGGTPRHSSGGTWKRSSALRPNWPSSDAGTSNCRKSCRRHASWSTSSSTKRSARIWHWRTPMRRFTQNCRKLTLPLAEGSIRKFHRLLQALSQKGIHSRKWIQVQRWATRNMTPQCADSQPLLFAEVQSRAQQTRGRRVLRSWRKESDWPMRNSFFVLQELWLRHAVREIAGAAAPPRTIVRYHVWRFATEARSQRQLHQCHL
mmetsp:Transcript_72978/g.144614  ORF Transcript_72978/g.144614 Transcript_72978/m.144614 type:complete len:255 (-) Transcript_72978:480-1244(-)